jgi:hypothetical protein
MTAWQWLVFVAIIAAFTLVQTWFIHKKIEVASDKTASGTASASKFDLLKTIIENAVPLLLAQLSKTPPPAAPVTVAVSPDPSVAPAPVPAVVPTTEVK